MEYWVIGIITLFGAGLTLFSGFGLGTILLPVFGIFFPIELAISMTAIVHFSNNLIKLGFFHRSLDRRIILIFGIPSIAAAFAGSYLLTLITDLQSIVTYSFFNKVFTVTPVKVIIAVLLLCFSLFEFLPGLNKIQIDKKYLPVGGLLSGFFGGLSGHQGALRSVFLIRSGLSKEMFIGTGVAIACLIDITRLSVYSTSIAGHLDRNKVPLLVVAVASAFIGVYFGNKLVKKITIRSLQLVVAVMLIIFSLLLGAGII